MPALPLSCYVTGTDTEIGKTFATCALLREWRAQGRAVIGMKPVASGCIESADGWRSEDALAHIEADGRADIDYRDRNPFALPWPVAPELAARQAGVEIALEPIRAAHARLRATPGVEGVLVEGVGGWSAPLTETLEQAEVVQALDLPVLMVVGLKLGCVHHARVTQRAILGDGARFAGWIANPVDPAMEAMAENITILARVLGEPPIRVLSRAR